MGYLCSKSVLGIVYLSIPKAWTFLLDMTMSSNETLLELFLSKVGRFCDNCCWFLPIINRLSSEGLIAPDWKVDLFLYLKGVSKYFLEFLKGLSK